MEETVGSGVEMSLFKFDTFCIIKRLLYIKISRNNRDNRYFVRQNRVGLDLSFHCCQKEKKMKNKKPKYLHMGQNKKFFLTKGHLLVVGVFTKSFCKN